MWEGDKEVQSQRNCRVPSVSHRYRAREERSERSTESGDSTVSVLKTHFKTYSNIFQIKINQSFSKVQKLFRECSAAAPGDPLHCWDDRCVLRQGSMPPAPGATSNDILWWINDESMMNYEHLQLWQMHNLLTVTWYIYILLLDAFRFPWRVPSFCKDLRNRYLTWIVRAVLCPFFICTIRRS